MALLRLPDVISRTGRSRSRIYADLQAGSFPKPVNIGPRAVAWIDTEIDAWIAERIADREQAAARNEEAGDEDASPSPAVHEGTYLTCTRILQSPASRRNCR